MPKGKYIRTPEHNAKISAAHMGKTHTPEACAKMSASHMKPLAERLWHSIIKEPRGCWLWQGCCTKGGYCQIGIDGRSQLVHRVVYELLAHVVPPGMILHHKCGVKNCCKPAHLRVMTQAAHRALHKKEGK